MCFPANVKNRQFQVLKGLVFLIYQPFKCERTPNRLFARAPPLFTLRGSWKSKSLNNPAPVGSNPQAPRTVVPGGWSLGIPSVSEGQLLTHRPICPGSIEPPKVGDMIICVLENPYGQDQQHPSFAI